MSRRRGLSDEDQALWAGFTRSITPLRRPAAAVEPAGPTAKPPAAAETAAATAEQNPVPTPARAVPPRETPKPPKSAPPPAPLDRRLRQRVARGREPIAARLDLHGMTQMKAHAELLRFLRGAQAEGAKMVLIVTGKGSGRSGDPAAERGVLRRQVPEWLRLPEFRSLIVGFDGAHVSHGGEGALYVRLRRPGRPERRR